MVEILQVVPVLELLVFGVVVSGGCEMFISEKTG